MSYNTYYLKFATQEEAEQKLAEVNYTLTDEYSGETVYRVTDSVGDIDIVGDIYEDVEDLEPYMGENGILRYNPPPIKIDGYHVNIIKEGDLPEALQEFVVEPKNPHRVFI